MKKKPAGRPTSPLTRLARGAICVALAASAVACGGESDKRLVESATAYLDKGETRSAIIQLKSALAKNERNGQARYLLGKALLVQGNAVAAQVEARKASDLKYSPALVAPLLARTMLAQGEADKVIEEFADLELDQPEGLAELKTLLATAYAAKGDMENARTALQASQRAVPLYPPALVLSARLKAASGDIEGALFLLDEVLARTPKDTERESALILKGDLLAHAKSDHPGALQAWRSALALRPASLPAHSSIITLLLQDKDVDGARAQFDMMKKVLPNRGETLLFEAQFAYLAGDDKKTREVTDQILKLSPDNIRALQLAGAAEYRMKALLPAENFLGRALKLQPSLLMARQLLARIYIRSGQPNKAVELLQPLLEGGNADAQTLALAGDAYLQTGDMKRSEEAYTRASRVAPQDPKVRTAMALTHLAKGNEQGFSELESVAASDEGMGADLALITSRLRRNDTEGALKAIDGLQKKRPDKAFTYYLRGRVLSLRKDDKAAVASFEKAVAIDPLYFPAVAALATLDLRSGKADQAKKRFDEMLRQDPKNYRALLALAELKARTGGSYDDVGHLLTEAVKLNPAEAAPRVLLVNLHLTAGRPEAALSTAQDASAALPSNLEVLDALGRAQVAAGSGQQAISTFKKLAALQPTRVQPQLRLADAYLAVRDDDGATQAYKHALEIQRDLVVAQRGLVSIALRDKRPLEALAIARSVQKQHPDDAVGWMLEGDVEAQRTNWDAAIVAYRSALQKKNATAEPAIKLHAAYMKTGKTADADRFAAGWGRDHPQDAAFFFYLGDSALAQHDWALAETRYRTVAKVQPDNALALNNIAWLLVKQSKPGAVEFADRANQLMPERAPLMDTLATALLADNQSARALEVQKRAVERAPGDAAMRLNLARIYLKGGDKDQARAELEKLAQLGDKFSGQAEVAALLKSI